MNNHNFEVRLVGNPYKYPPNGSESDSETRHLDKP